MAPTADELYPASVHENAMRRNMVEYLAKKNTADANHLRKAVPRAGPADRSTSPPPHRASGSGKKKAAAAATKKRGRADEPKARPRKEESSDSEDEAPISKRAAKVAKSRPKEKAPDRSLAMVVEEASREMVCEGGGGDTELALRLVAAQKERYDSEQRALELELEVLRSGGLAMRMARMLPDSGRMSADQREWVEKMFDNGKRWLAEMTPSQPNRTVPSKKRPVSGSARADNDREEDEEDGEDAPPKKKARKPKRVEGAPRTGPMDLYHTFNSVGSWARGVSINAAAGSYSQWRDLYKGDEPMVAKLREALATRDKLQSEMQDANKAFAEGRIEPTEMDTLNKRALSARKEIIKSCKLPEMKEPVKKNPKGDAEREECREKKLKFFCVCERIKNILFGY